MEQSKDELKQALTDAYTHIAELNEQVYNKDTIIDALCEKIAQMKGD